MRTIGQSLTERLNIVSHDKMNKFNSTSASGIQTIIQALRAEEARCKCLHRANSSLNSSRVESRQGHISTLVTPSKNESKFDLFVVGEIEVAL